MSSDKQWLATHVSQFCPAGLILEWRVSKNWNCLRFLTYSIFKHVLSKIIPILTPFVLNFQKRLISPIFFLNTLFTDFVSKKLQLKAFFIFLTQSCKNVRNKPKKIVSGENFAGHVRSREVARISWTSRRLTQFGPRYTHGTKWTC